MRYNSTGFFDQGGYSPASNFKLVPAGKNNIAKEHYEMLAEFRYGLRRFLRFSENAARAAGVTPQQHQAMLAIKGFPGRDHITIGELAERLQILHHSPSGWPTGLSWNIMCIGCQAKKIAARLILPSQDGVKLFSKNSPPHTVNNCNVWGHKSANF